jgi:hypothetical protein
MSDRITGAKNPFDALTEVDSLKESGGPPLARGNKVRVSGHPRARGRQTSDPLAGC